MYLSIDRKSVDKINTSDTTPSQKLIALNILINQSRQRFSVLTINSLSQSLGMNKKRVERHIKALVDKGILAWVSVPGDKRYYLAVIGAYERMIKITDKLNDAESPTCMVLTHNDSEIPF